MRPLLLWWTVTAGLCCAAIAASSCGLRPAGGAACRTNAVRSGQWMLPCTVVKTVLSVLFWRIQALGAEGYRVVSRSVRHCLTNLIPGSAGAGDANARKAAGSVAQLRESSHEEKAETTHGTVAPPRHIPARITPHHARQDYGRGSRAGLQKVQRDSFRACRALRASLPVCASFG